MATNPTKEQLDQLAKLQDLLVRDGNGNHQLLAYYLKLILNNRPLELKMPDGKPFKISPELAWNEILKWNEKAGLPMGDNGSRKIRASRLLNYLDLIQGSTREAATNFQAIKDSINALDKATPITDRGQTIKKMVDIRKLQLEIHNRQVIGQLASQLEQTSFIKRFAGDRPTQIALAGLFAANAANFINADVPNHVIAEEIAKLIQLNAGRTNSINNAIHLAYSKTAQDKELSEITASIGDFVSKKHQSPSEFIQETNRIVHYSHILTVGDIPELVNMLAPTASIETRQSLTHALQTTIIRSTSSYYTSGETLLAHAFNLAGLPEAESKNLSSLAHFLEEIRGTELHNTISGDLNENDPRILNTLNISGEVGVSAHIPWLSREDLDAQASNLQQKYDTQNLAKSLQDELKNGENADFEKISAIKKLFSNIDQHNYYNRTLGENPLYYLSDKISKARGRVAAVTSPIDRFSQKVGKAYWAVDDFAHSPFRYVADQWTKIEEKIPILNPGNFVYNKFSGLQLKVAKIVLDWSDNLIGKGHWASGILTHVSDFTSGFISEGGSWHGANFVFVQKKWGNLLDWGAQKAKYKNWEAVKVKIGTKLWDGFSKMAPGMAEKLAGGQFGKLVASLVAGELTAGTSLLIQAGLMLGWEAVNGVWKFLTDHQVREKFFNRLPAIIGGLGLAVSAIPAALVGGLIAGGSAILAWIGTALASLFSFIFLPAMIATGSLILAFFFIFQVFQTTIKIDSGVGQVITSILCDESGETGDKTSVNTAMCIVKILSECGMNPLTSGNANSSKWQCALAGLVAQDAMEELKRSASSFAVLQCVGLVAAVDIAGGGSGSFPDAKNMDTIHPSNYKYVAGVGSCSPGDIFVDKSGTWGHTGIFMGVAGPVIKCIDANGGGPGVVRGVSECTWLTSKIAGCLKKM